jgi:hypothetical protein
MKAPNQEPADAGVGGQAFIKGNGVGMGKYFENLDDLEDNCRPPAVDWDGVNG